MNNGLKTGSAGIKNPAELGNLATVQTRCQAAREPGQTGIFSTEADSLSRANLPQAKRRLLSTPTPLDFNENDDKSSGNY
ncbi:MAG: hypothetical protein IMY82_03365 [Chloroflexi bacterium]|nr:hypothetical protein [Chloroflexota bacterium]